PACRGQSRAARRCACRSIYCRTPCDKPSCLFLCSWSFSIAFNINVGFDRRRFDERSKLVAELVVDIVLLIPGTDREDKDGVDFRDFVRAVVAVQIQITRIDTGVDAQRIAVEPYAAEHPFMVPDRAPFV